MNPAFEAEFARVVGLEGHYSNNPADAGGETKFGIIAKTARQYGYTGPMVDMPLSAAQSIYLAGWWNVMRLDDVVALAGARIAGELFECAVNLSPMIAVKFLQRALNSFNQQATLYPDLIADGGMGPATLSALNAYMGKRKILGETVLLRALNAQQGVYYLERSEARPLNEAFSFGWFANRVTIS